MRHFKTLGQLKSINPWKVFRASPSISYYDNTITRPFIHLSDGLKLPTSTSGALKNSLSLKSSWKDVWIQRSETQTYSVPSFVVIGKQPLSLSPSSSLSLSHPFPFLHPSLSESFVPLWHSFLKVYYLVLRMENRVLHILRQAACHWATSLSHSPLVKVGVVCSPGWHHV